MTALPAHTRVIKAEHLTLALFTSRLYKRSGHPAPAWAALSNGHNSLGCGCPRRPYDEHLQKRLQHPPMFLVANRISPRLVERVRLTHGLAEVKATWGVGYKTLLTELKQRKGA